MKRYVLLEIDEDGPETRVDAVEIDEETGFDIAEAVRAWQWTMGQSRSIIVAVAVAVSEMIR